MTPTSVNCSVCGQPTIVFNQVFFSGSPDRPLRTWKIDAPLYFSGEVGTEDVEAVFCSAVCGANYQKT